MGVWMQEYRDERYRRERGAGFSFAQMGLSLAVNPQFGVCSPRTKGRLYLLLKRARSEYEMRTATKEVPSVGAVKSELENIRQSIGRVAAFGRGALPSWTKRQNLGHGPKQT